MAPSPTSNAQCNLGTCYAKGRGVRLGVDVQTWYERWEKAVYWFSLSRGIKQHNATWLPATSRVKVSSKIAGKRSAGMRRRLSG